MDWKKRAHQLKIEIPAVCLAMRKRETPIMAKILAAATVGYALSPIDLIPDFIPVLGYLDDLLILPGLVALTIWLIPETVMAECRLEAQDLCQGGIPKKRIYALPVLLIWLGVIILFLRKFFS